MAQHAAASASPVPFRRGRGLEPSDQVGRSSGGTSPKCLHDIVPTAAFRHCDGEAFEDTQGKQIGGRTASANRRARGRASGRSLDFDRIRYIGPLGSGVVSVEVSYREDVVEEPDTVPLGGPYYEPFLMPVMKLDEMVAEKLRALAQRDRPTDLSDVAMILRDNTIEEGRVRDLAARKFELVKAGDHRERIEDTITRLGAQYDDAVAAVAPDAPIYATAAKLVRVRLSALLP